MSDADEPAQSEVPAQLVEHFAVFRSPAFAPEREIEGGAMFGDHPLVDRFGLLPSKAVRVSVSPSQEVWVIPGTRGATLRFTLGVGRTAGAMGGVSGRLESVALRGLCAYSVALDGVHQTVYGLVPDGNDFVTVELVDGESVAVPVKKNIYTFTSAVRLRSVESVNAAGEKDRRMLRRIQPG